MFHDPPPAGPDPAAFFLEKQPWLSPLESAAQTPSPFVSTLDGMMAALQVATAGDGGKRLAFSAAPGLYQLSVFLDAAAFDWESLYVNLDDFGNTGQRTGPWDFGLKDLQPVVPSYWVTLDGRKLGLWYMQRVSLEDIRNRRFRGRLAFLLDEPGEHELAFEPFRPMQVDWISAVLEIDPDDVLAPPPKQTAGPEALPVAAWSSPAFWEQQRGKLQTTHAIYRKPLEAVFEWLQKMRQNSWADLVPLLLAAHHLGHRPGALERALQIVADLVALPAWGRVRPDVYGHNGDIGAAHTLRCMSWAYHMLKDELSAEARQKLLDKLVCQGDAFLTQALLMRDYWGGSLLQDHGRHSLIDYATCALHLWGVAPQAERWLKYVLPRVQRGLDAAPPDGVIPGSSYYALYMYAHNATWYRDTLLARTGIDVLDHPSLRGLPSFVARVMHEGEHAMLVAEAGDKIPLVGGQALMAYIAAKHGDAEAGRVHRTLLESPELDFYHPGQMMGYYTGVLWGFFAYDPAAPVAADPPKERRQMVYYEDSAFVQYRDDAQGVVLALRCGPWLGYHTHRKATGPCDRMECVPGAGHFALFLDGLPMLSSPDTGYRLRSFLRSCMLVDDQGQIGDTGYPMSIPSEPHRGEEIEHVRWDPATACGSIRLNLKRAYPTDLGVTHYTRQFTLSPQRRIVCHDHVVFDRPRRPSWLFQFKHELGGTVEEGALRAQLGTRPRLTISAETAGVALTASIQRTQVVWSYASANDYKPFDHVRYDANEPTLAATAAFTFSW